MATNPSGCVCRVHRYVFVIGRRHSQPFFSACCASRHLANSLEMLFLSQVWSFDDFSLGTQNIISRNEENANALADAIGMRTFIGGRQTPRFRLKFTKNEFRSHGKRVDCKKYFAEIETRNKIQHRINLFDDKFCAASCMSPWQPTRQTDTSIVCVRFCF